MNECRKAHIPVFMKSSLADIWGEPMIQEFPEGLKKVGVRFEFINNSNFTKESK